jgi:hypothetical protein
MPVWYWHCQHLQNPTQFSTATLSNELFFNWTLSTSDTNWLFPWNFPLCSLGADPTENTAFYCPILFWACLLIRYLATDVLLVRALAPAGKCLPSRCLATFLYVTIFIYCLCIAYPKKWSNYVLGLCRNKNLQKKKESMFTQWSLRSQTFVFVIIFCSAFAHSFLYGTDWEI